jgi:hypothetical protein
MLGDKAMTPDQKRARKNELRRKRDATKASLGNPQTAIEQHIDCGYLADTVTFYLRRALTRNGHTMSQPIEEELRCIGLAFRDMSRRLVLVEKQQRREAP